MKSLQYFRHPFSAMGSPCCVHLYAPASDALQIARQMEAEVRRLEHKYSRYRSDSLTAQIHAAARAGRRLQVDGETAALLDYAQAAWEQSEGLFDITSGVLRQVWKFPDGPLPAQPDIDALLPRIGWHQVHWQYGELGFARPDMEIDFGGFVKEYAADCAAAVALQAGVRHGLVELGGDIRVIGPHPDGQPWSAGIHHPRQSGHVWATLSLAQGALASSGDYERCIVHNGQRYGHVLNPFTGWPVEGLVAVSVVAEHCLLAGTLTTLAMLRGELGLSWLADQQQPWLAMDAAGHTFGSLSEATPAEAL